jgi:aconitate hydratase 2/2-methylisocitrate dehydratase
VLESYRAHVAERAALGIPPLPLTAKQTEALVGLLKSPPAGEEANLLELITYRVPAGVDDAAKVKAEFLARVAKGDESLRSGLEGKGDRVARHHARRLQRQALDRSARRPDWHDCRSRPQEDAAGVRFLPRRQGTGRPGQRQCQVRDAELGRWRVVHLAATGARVAEADCLQGNRRNQHRRPVAGARRLVTPGHSAARAGHAQECASGIEPDKAGERGPIKQLEALASKGNLIAYVGDVVGTGSSRKSATNSVLWFTGEDIPYVPNKRFGGVCLGSKIAPIFFNTMEDAGALPVEIDCGQMDMGDEIELRIDAATSKVTALKNGAVIAESQLKTPVILDEVRAGGRIPLIVGRGLTTRAREALGLPPSTLFTLPQNPADPGKGYSLAQKMVGRACGLPEGKGVLPGTYCEPRMTTVGSQDTTGPMTRDELKDLACLGFSADMVMQSFCHTAAYPKLVDVRMHRELPSFISTRGGVALRPGDGVIHSWLNRLLLPDTVGTGGDSHTRFPIGISFPAGSGLVAFAAATGVMPLDMPESVLVRFKGSLTEAGKRGVTLRDLVNAIPYYAIQAGLLTVEKKGKKNIFSGRILEIEGLPDLKVEQAFELSDAAAERSAAACAVALNKEPIIEYMRSNITLMKWMIANGYSDARTLGRRIKAMEAWIAKPELLRADADAQYAAVIEIDLADVLEPLVACPNDPDDVKLLSAVSGTKIDEVFIGSCMTNIGHFRAAGKVLEGKTDIPTRLWIAPPTKMDAMILNEEGYYAILGKSGARMEMPGCSLCMGNQAQIRKGSTAMSTSTRNFPNRLGIDTNVYLGSAELAAVCALMGRIPTPTEYLEQVQAVNAKAADVYRYMNFDQIKEFSEVADTVTV